MAGSFRPEEYEMTVTPLFGRTSRLSENFECECGSQWFELRGSAPDLPPAVVFDAHGHITATAALPQCIECGLVPDLPTDVID